MFENIPVVILAGGRGTRLSEETQSRPKPLVEVGSTPIIHHIINYYAAFGFKQFFVCCGYKGEMIKSYFLDALSQARDMKINYATGDVSYIDKFKADIEISLIDTGQHSMTGGRIGRLRPYLESSENFCMTYGDGLADVDLKGLINFHLSHKKDASLTAVRPPGRFGALMLEDNRVLSFSEKIEGETSWINGGFFVLKPKVLDLIDSDQTVWEQEPLQRLAEVGQLCAFKHDGFWHPMDTLRDKLHLEKIFDQGDAPWIRRND